MPWKTNQLFTDTNGRRFIANIFDDPETGRREIQKKRELAPDEPWPPRAPEAERKARESALSAIQEHLLGDDSYLDAKNKQDFARKVRFHNEHG